MQLRVLQIVGPLWPVTKAGVSRGVLGVHSHSVR